MLLGPETGISCPEAFVGRHGVALEMPWPAQYEPGRHPHLSAFELLHGAVCKVEQTSSSEASGQAAQAQHHLEPAPDCHGAFRLPQLQQQPGFELCSGSQMAPQAMQRPGTLQSGHAEDRHAAELRSPSKPPNAKVSLLQTLSSFAKLGCNGHFMGSSQVASCAFHWRVVLLFLHCITHLEGQLMSS